METLKPAQTAEDAKAPEIRRWRGWLALCSLLGPFIAIAVLSLFFGALISPALHQGSAKLTFRYTAATPADASGDNATQEKSGATAVTADATMFLPARDYAGHAAYAIACAFLAIVALATFVFSAAVVVRYSNWRVFLLATLVWSLVAWAVACYFSDVHGRYLVVRDLLNAADRFPGLAPFVIFRGGQPSATGQLLENLIFVDTVIALIPIGMLLSALALLTWRPPRSFDKPTLIARRFLLRCLLWFASASFVMGVLCNKALVEWPLTLVSAGQALALTPVANSLVLQFGALGTAAIFAAFLPAIAAWSLDAHTVNETLRANAQPGAPADELKFATMPAITSIMAVIAPLLTSPVVDSFRSVLGALSK